MAWSLFGHPARIANKAYWENTFYLHAALAVMKTAQPEGWDYLLRLVVVHAQIFFW
jgi:hypothetical protein